MNILPRRKHSDVENAFRGRVAVPCAERVSRKSVPSPRRERVTSHGNVENKLDKQWPLPSLHGEAARGEDARCDAGREAKDTSHGKESLAAINNRERSLMSGAA